ncbi:ferric-chelate reductase 1-like protein [Carex littledalei]|uniref:Cytochrome b561 and DOMON domain-containing protein n=1 Tax=Carex littledalei TaxID=544730 RepID=A0A833VK79_9POAL|nr:ferric-chelate reductase 1-like protein [Carex littledalei]
MPHYMHYLFSIQVGLLFLTSSLCLSTKAQDYRCPPCEKSNTTYLCRSLPTLGAKIRLCYYNTTPNATLDVVFSMAPLLPVDWVAWGLNPVHAQMIDSQVLIAHRNPDKGVNVSQAVLSYDTKHGCGRVSRSGFEVNIYRASANYFEDSRTMILYAKLGLPHWCNSTRLNHVWQVGPGMNRGEPLRHMMRLQNFDSRETINLTNGHVLGHKRKSLRKAHGILGIIGWGLLLPCGVITVRYFRGLPFDCHLGSRVHAGFQICAYTVGTVGWAIGLSLQADHFATFRAHRIIGITIFCLATLQMLASFLKPTKADRYRHYWNLYHHFVGYALLSLVVINILKGFAILQPPKIWEHTYIGLLILLASIAFVLEIVTWVRFYNLTFEYTFERKIKLPPRPNAGSLVPHHPPATHS